MTKRRLRLALGIVGGLVGLLVLVVLLLPLLVPREHLRKMAEQRAVAATGGEVSLGEVSLRVLPRLRLVLGASTAVVTGDGLRGAGQDPGPLVRAEASLERLEVDLALWPLLRKQLEFGQVALIAPRLDVVTVPADSVAARQPPAADAQAAPGEPPPPTAMDYSMTLASVTVRDGALRWREEGTGLEVAAEGWMQEASAPHFGVLVQRLLRLRGDALPVDAVPEPVTLELSTRVASLELHGTSEQPLPPLTDLRLEGALTLPPAADRASFTVSELAMTGWRADLAGHATRDRVTVDAVNLAGGEAIVLGGRAGFGLPPHRGPLVCDLAGTVDLALILDQVAPWLPPQPGDSPPLPTFTGGLQVDLAVDLEAPPPLDDPEAWRAAWREGLAGKARLTARGTGLQVAAAQLGEPLAIGELRLDGDLSAAAAASRLELKGLAHPALQGDAAAQVRPQGGAERAVRADLALPRIDLDALAVLAEAMQAAETAFAPPDSRRGGFSLVSAAHAATAGGGAPAPGELIPPDLAVDLTATVQELVFLKSTYTDGRVTGTLRERVIEAGELTARLGAGRLTGGARLDYRTDPRGEASWDVQVQDAPAGLLLAPYVPLLAEIWTGALSAEAAGACDLADPQAILNSLSVAGLLRGSDGVIDLREQLGGVRQYLGDRPDLLRVRYGSALQRFRVEDGKIVVDELRLEGRDTDWRGGGWLGLDGTVDLDLDVRLPAGFTPDLGDLTFLAEGLRDEDGRIALSFSLTGDLRRPAVGLNLDPASMLQKDTVKQKLEEEGKKQLQKLQEELKKSGAGSMLDRIKRGGGGG